MHILLTRPLEDSKEFIVKLKSLGHKVSHLPVIEVNKLKIEKIKFNEYSGIIFTSVNAVRFLDTKDINLSLINISKPTKQAEIPYAVFCLKKKIK